MAPGRGETKKSAFQRTDFWCVGLLSKVEGGEYREEDFKGTLLIAAGGIARHHVKSTRRALCTPRGLGIFLREIRRQGNRAG